MVRRAAAASDQEFFLLQASKLIRDNLSKVGVKHSRRF